MLFRRIDKKVLSVGALYAVTAAAGAIGCAIALRSAWLGYSLNRPALYWDHVIYINEYSRWLTGQLYLSELLGFHNEHRIFIPRLLSLIDASYFDFSNRFAIGLIYALLTTMPVTLWLIARPIPVDLPAIAMAAAMVGFGLSICQWENLSSGFQTCFPLVHFFALTCFICFGRMLETQLRWRRAAWFALAFALDFAGTFSLASGVMIGAAALTACLWQRKVNTWAIAFGLCHAAMVAWYLHGAPFHALPPDLSPRHIVHFYMRCIGSLGRVLPTAADAIGITMALIAACFLGWGAARQKGPGHSAILAMICFILLQTATTTFGRIILGLDASLAARYSTQSLILAVALIVLAWERMSSPICRSLIALTAIVLALVANADSNILEWRDNIAIRDTAMFAFINGLYPPAHAAAIYTKAAMVERDYKELASWRKGPFALDAVDYRPPLNVIPSIDLSTIPACHGLIESAAAHEGWSELRGFTDGPSWILAYSADGRLAGYARSTIRRPDVAKALALSDERVGFDLFARIDTPIVVAIAIDRSAPACRISPINPPTALSTPEQTAALCSIDSVNDRPYQHVPTHKAVDGTVRLQGWTAPPADAESSSMNTWVTLISLDGKMQYFKAPPQSRPDVAEFFKRPALKESGFNITLGLSARPGKQTINLFSVSGEAAYKCSMGVEIE